MGDMAVFTTAGEYSREHRARQRAGFTLIELMAAVAVFGILVSIAAPAVYRSMDTMQSKQDAESLGGRLRLARSQAVSGFCDVVVFINRDGAGTYTVLVDNGGGNGTPDDPNFVAANKNNGLPDANERLMSPVRLAERAVFGYVPGAMNAGGDFLDEAISFDGNPPRITFHADGTADADGWISVLPLEDFLEQTPGRDYLIEITATTGEVAVARAEH